MTDIPDSPDTGQDFDEKGYAIAVWLDVHDKNIYAGTITIRFCGFYGELHWSEPTCG